MGDLTIYAASFVVAIGLLVVVHEFGHYWVARRLGVKVLRFSIGFGRPLWMRRVGKDQMELVVGWLPLGGYVRMLDETEGEVAAAELPRAFTRQPVWKRMAIVLAGPAFNLAFAVAAYWLVFAAGPAGIKPVIGHVVPASIAERAGFEAGETILSMDGRPVQAWNERRLYLFRRALEQRPVEVEIRTASGELRTRTLDLSDFPVEQIHAALVERGIGLVGYLPRPLPVLAVVEEGPAAAAGMRVNDRVVEIGGRRITNWEELARTVRENPGRALPVEVERNGERVRLEVTPALVESDGKRIGRISVRPQASEIPTDMRIKLQYGVLGALRESVENTWTMSWLTVDMLYRMLKLEVSTRNISGPITIAEYAGQSAKIGIEPFILFLAVISISLGVLNLLPIPVLDGGHFVYYAIEAVTGRPLPERVLAIGQQVGIFLLAGLMFLAFYNDIARLLRW